MSGKENSVDYKVWPKGDKINEYAIFMGYLLMGVRGLGLLVLTWTTVVLLGGFVSILEKKDFWCLTIITLVQTAGVFDFLLKDKASDVEISFNGLIFSATAALFKEVTNNTGVTSENKEEKDVSKRKKEEKEPSTARKVLGVILLVVQVLMFAVVLCPLAILYVLGLYLSAAISLWRLIQHDYGNTDGSTNLMPALNVLYSLAVAQGVVYGYRTIYDMAVRTGLVQEVADFNGLDKDLVSKYLDETMAGCMKDPSHARGRNLVTYAVDLLMKSWSRHGYVSGVLILGAVIKNRETGAYAEPGLIKVLLTGSASFSYVVSRLLETFGPRSPYSTEIRLRAARIVRVVADSIHLDHFPAQGMMIIRCISSLLDTFEEYSWRLEGSSSSLPKEYERFWMQDELENWYCRFGERVPTATSYTGSPRLQLQGYKLLVVQGLRILQGLAVDEDNCRVICNDEGLLSKALAPLTTNQQLHSGDYHDEWCSMAEESLELMKRLLATPGGTETTTKIQSVISVNKQVILSTLERILECLKCQVLLKSQAVEVLLDLCVDDVDTPASIMPGGSNSKMFLWLLMPIIWAPGSNFRRMQGSTRFLRKFSHTIELASKKLEAMLSSSQTDLRSVGAIIVSLSRTAAGAENNGYIRIHAAWILRDLIFECKRYEGLIKKSMTDVMPEVLTQVVCWRGTREETKANTGDKVSVVEAGTDLEQGGVSQDDDNNGQGSSSTASRHQQQKCEQHMAIKLQKALIYLCYAIVSKWIDEDHDLTRELNRIAVNVCWEQRMPAAKAFEALLNEADEKYWEVQSASGLTD